MTAEPTDDEGTIAGTETSEESTEGERTEEPPDRVDPDESTEGERTEESSDGVDPDESTESQQPQKGPNEMYCSSCGAIVKKRAEICPECGVATDGAAVGVSRTTGSSPSGVATGGSSSNPMMYLVGGVISGLIGFVFLPIVFGPVSIYCGYTVYQNHDETQGIALMAWGGASLVVGMAVGALILG